MLRLSSDEALARLAPHRGFVWPARAAAVISGPDAYVDGQGAMRWRILGLARVLDELAPGGAPALIGITYVRSFIQALILRLPPPYDNNQSENGQRASEVWT